MKKSIIKWLVKWFIIKMNLYLVWSKINQKLFQRHRTPLPELTLDEMMGIIASSKWTADKWWMLWDAISHPEYAYWNYLTNGTLGDCDDHALFAADYVCQWFDNTRILSFQWVNKSGKFCGHNICIYDDLGGTSFISNGYTMPVTFFGEGSQKKCIENFVRDGELLSWFTFDPNLKGILDYGIM